MAKRHWTEVLQCSCGMRFRDMAAEAKHRHNFPMFCRRPKDRPNRTTSDDRTGRKADGREGTEKSG